MTRPRTALPALLPKPGGSAAWTSPHRSSRGTPYPFVDTMPVLADGGYEGAGHGVLTPVKKPPG